MTERFDFDGSLKDLFQKDRPWLLRALAGGRRVKAFLNVELPKVQERRVDLVVLLDDDTILHVELQSTNDHSIVYRVGHYYLLLKEQYGLPVRQVVLYMGAARMSMPKHLEADGNRFAFEVIDIREFGAEEMMKSGRAGDLALAILAGGADRQLPEILKRLVRLRGSARQRAVAQLMILSGLRGLQEKIEWELRNLGVVIDITKNTVLMRWQREFTEKARVEGKAEGKAEGMTRILHGQLEAKFGRLPKWADDRLAKATPAQLERWAQKVLTAATLEAVVSRPRQ